MTTLRAPSRILLVGAASAAHVMQFVDENYMPFPTSTAADAAKKLQAGRYEFAVVDVALSDRPAAAFIASIRAEEALAQLPILVTSATNDLDAIEACLASGADDYLPASCGQGILRVRIAAAIDRRSLQDTQAMRRDMVVARNIQRDFLPEALPVVPGVELDAALQPARQVSGDFFDAFLVGTSGRLLLVVGDVCDKGVGAALFMALFRSLIRASADPVAGGAEQTLGRPAPTAGDTDADGTPELLIRVASFTNNYIAHLHGRTNMFATAFLACLRPSDGELVYVNAGHEPALIVAPDGSIEELRPTGPALGMVPDSPFKAVTRSLPLNHSLFAFTDGLSEARSASGVVFGNERLRAAVRDHGGRGASALVHGLLETMEAFTRLAEPHDDLTMLAATRNGCS
ncbi:MAG: SpoIIE family protein phosphatase [Gemmatimonas sp.]